MAQITDSEIRNQLLDRQKAVAIEIDRVGHTAELDRLLAEVNAALIRVDDGTFGLCEVCLEPIEHDRLAADPLVRVCLDHLTTVEQRALERDLELAAKIQRGLLPAPYARVSGWEINYHYHPASIVSGDYCDYFATHGGDLYFMIGDVSGKGVAASMLMSHLHATFRTLILMNLPLDQLVTQASRLFSESALPAQYATLVCGKSSRTGHVEIANAGHPAPLVVREGRVDRIDATGLPMGMFRNQQFEIHRLAMRPGEMFVLYTDGLVEAEDEVGTEYGIERLSHLVARSAALELPSVVQACVKDLESFKSGTGSTDDVTIMTLRRTAFEFEA